MHRILQPLSTSVGGSERESSSNEDQKQLFSEQSHPAADEEIQCDFTCIPHSSGRQL